ncbi:MAG: SRPBCC domain-containing protein [Pseudomonadota bacterium]|uniref:SRPBCC domain-containing protein n=1 Tax=Acinetobacter bereziniae TaxID=106648 RepID=A0A8I1AH39_ACIBZ|nr:SRPBCC domain-containing protein [Acinetobacter bereziniae]MEC8123391.1 SRPBCC domain-containing protein [Pseudomonadota bacterium]QQC86512.1 SRPBCC domain-containing protein [Acinetobacter bereziniae]UUN99767.1 SRPBCC domain-containing protein [Acinetobacter bereziniae]
MNQTIETQMLIRKPVAEVFNAFIDPAITTKFWFSSSTGPLKEGKIVQWSWDKYQVKSKVMVFNILENKLIQIAWGEDPKTSVDFIFEAVSVEQTYVTIRNYDIPLQGSELIKFIIDATGGFTTVLDGLKAYLEHGLVLNLVEDKFPPF